VISAVLFRNLSPSSALDHSKSQEPQTAAKAGRVKLLAERKFKLRHRSMELKMSAAVSATYHAAR
jgi:hypothetical protein